MSKNNNDNSRETFYSRGTGHSYATDLSRPWIILRYGQGSAVRPRSYHTYTNTHSLVENFRASPNFLNHIRHILINRAIKSHNSQLDGLKIDINKTLGGF